MALTPEKQRALEDIRAHVSGSEAIEAPVKANIFFSRSVDTAALRQTVDRLVASSGLASVQVGKSLLGARTVAIEASLHDIERLMSADEVKTILASESNMSIRPVDKG